MNKPKEFTPPKFCPNAVASNAGWINPIDNSLIIPNRGLATRLKEWNAKEKARATSEFENEAKKKEIVEQLAKTINSIDTPEEKPVKNKKTKKDSKESSNG